MGPYGRRLPRDQGRIKGQWKKVCWDGHSSRCLDAKDRMSTDGSRGGQQSGGFPKEEKKKSLYYGDQKLRGGDRFINRRGGTGVCVKAKRPLGDAGLKFAKKSQGIKGKCTEMVWFQILKLSKETWYRKKWQVSRKLWGVLLFERQNLN